MSEGDVSLIQDEDVLRRMWQQTEDFSRKKEIRAHMYRLREERLRNLYSPEPTLQGKDLKELSNAGWNVESENSTTDNGHTKVKSVQANIEGRYDVEGGTGQFTAIDHHKQAVTQYQDDNTSLKRNQSSSNTAAHEQVFRQTDDGTQFQSTTSSSTSTSKFEKVSSTKQEAVPYVIKNEYDMSRQTSPNTKCDTDQTKTSQFTNIKDNGQTLRITDYEQAELVSRKVEYPDENTKIIVETRCLPDGTRVTNTRREFRAPVFKKSHTEQHSQNMRTEKSTFLSSHNRSEFNENSNNVGYEDIDRKAYDIVDHQKAADEEDFRKYRQSDTYNRDHSSTDNRYPNQNRYHDDENQTVVNSERNVHEHSFSNKFTEDQPFTNNNVQEPMEEKIKHGKHGLGESIRNEATQINEKNYTETVQKQIIQEFDDTKTSENKKHETKTKNEKYPVDMRQVKQFVTDNMQDLEYTNERVDKRIQNKETTEVIEKKTTYQTDYSQKKISNDWSPTHQAWANTLRGDTPSVTKSSTRASSPGSKTFKSSNSSLRSSVSPDKTHKKPPSRGGSPNKNDRFSPSRASSDRFFSHSPTTTEARQNRRPSPEEKYPNTSSPTRQSPSPSRKSQDRYQRDSSTLEKHSKDIISKTSASPLKDGSPSRGTDQNNLIKRDSKARETIHIDSTLSNTGTKRSSVSPQKRQDRKSSESPDKEPFYHYQIPTPSDQRFNSTPESSLNNNQSSNPKSLPPDSQSRDTSTNRFITRPNRNPESPKEVSPQRKPASNQIRKPSPAKHENVSTHMKRPSDNNLITGALSPRTSPIRSLSSPEKKPGEKHRPSISPERKLLNETNYSTMTNTQKTLYKLDAVETEINNKISKMTLSPDARTPTKMSSRSPSPSKRPITKTQLDENYVSDITLCPSIKGSKDSNANHCDISQHGAEIPTYNATNREDMEKKNINSGVHTNIENHKTKKSPTTSKETEYPITQINQSPKYRTSPSKSSVKDYKHTSEFINTEKVTEENNKKLTNRNHPRQLVTPSSSPTRKPKLMEKSPSTGQSSPTTSVSGFVYFSSSSQEKCVNDEKDNYLTYNEDRSENINKINENLNRKPQTPSKIPCRSPSPEKSVYESKDSFPRKSSLKKHTKDATKSSPTETPPTDFCISPTDANKHFHESENNHISQKDDSFKPKPPLERRETYEERCRKILGMIDDSNKTTTSDVKTCFRKLESNPSYPSISPCASPDYQSNQLCNRENVSEFISHEKDENKKTTAYRITHNEKKISKELSPTKLQDIVSQPITINKDLSSTVTESLQEDTKDTYRPTRTSASPSKRDVDTSPKSDRIQENPSHPRASSPTQTVSSPQQLRDKSLSIVSKDRSPNRQTQILKSRTPSPNNKVKAIQSNKRPNKTTHVVVKDGSPLKDSETPQLNTSSTCPEIQGDKTTPRVTSPIRTISPAKQSPDKSFQTRPKDRSPAKESITLRSRTPSPAGKTTSPSRNISPTKQTPNKISGIVPNAHSPLRESKIPRSRTPSPTKKSPTFNESDYEHHQRTNYESGRGMRQSPQRQTYSLSPENNITTAEYSETVLSSESTYNILQKPQISESCVSLIKSEREQEILDRVQKTLRKLSPDRKKLSLDHKNYPDSKRENVVQEKDSPVEIEDDHEIKGTSLSEVGNTKHRVSKGKDEILPSKLPSRSVSPQKKSSSLVKSGDLHTSVKSRSISPRKPVSPIERQQSLQIQKSTGIKSKETTVTRKPTSPTKVEKSVPNKDSKKNVISKQTSVNKITTVAQTNKSQQSNIKLTEQEMKRQTFSTKVTRTASDNSIKITKTPQKVKNKPEVKVNNVATTKLNNQSHNTTKMNRSKPKGPDSKLDKPKSSTTLNSSSEDNDIMIDVQLAKSSRESSPDHICPTPVNFQDDFGTPRLPDEVSEPDDDYRKRTHHTIHETETIVDDIVEIDEEDELFVKRPEIENVKSQDDIKVIVDNKHSSVTNKMQSEYKPKYAIKKSKNSDQKIHSNSTHTNYDHDESLLSVSEKVNKFAKGSRNLMENKSPTRNIVDEFDRNTVYQDDYTKLSVNDKAHFFVETAENIKLNKNKTPKLVERPDLTNVDDSLKSDDCLLSVSDKVNKFVKTAEQFLNETKEDEEKDRKIKIQHEQLMKKIVQESEDEIEVHTAIDRKSPEKHNRLGSFAKDTTSSHAKAKDFASPNLKPTEKPGAVKITSLRSSEAVKKAKELFENISSVSQKSNETKTTKLTDIGVIKKPSTFDTTIILHSSIDNRDTENTDIHSEINDYCTRTSKATEDQDSSDANIQLYYTEKQSDKILENVPNTISQCPSKYRNELPISQNIGTANNKTTVKKYSVVNKNEDFSPNYLETQTENIPGYQRPTKTSQLKEETKVTDDIEISSRRGSGKFGVELRRTSTDRSTVSSERRRSVEHHQPCIEDIFDLDLLEQMLEKVVGYEQRRRIRSQIRIAKKRVENDIQIDTNTFTKVKNTNSNITETRSSERHSTPATIKTVSSEQQSVQRTTNKSKLRERSQPKELNQSTPNGYTIVQEKTDHRSRSPNKLNFNITQKTTSPIRQPSPEKKARKSPNKTVSAKPKVNRFNEYASAYMKRVGLNETNKIVSPDSKTKNVTDNSDERNIKRIEEHNITHKESSVTLTSTSLKDTTDLESTEIIQSNGKRTPSPDNKRSPQRKLRSSAERLQQRSPSPKIKRVKPDHINKETIIKTVHDIDKKLQPKKVQDEKPSWVTNRNLKKITSETRTFSSKKLEPEKPKYRSASPSKVISKPIDMITSSYGPGPLDADGKPLFGIKALRNGATNYQVKGTVIRQEFHSRNGGEPEGTVSVTAYSAEPEDLEKLLQAQGEKPSRIHGLAAITTTKKFGGDTGMTLKDAHSKEECSTLEQFTQNDRRVTDSKTRGVTDTRVGERRGQTPETRERPESRDGEKKTLRQSSVKSLTEKYIKSTSESSRPVGGSYPKAGLILRSANLKDSVSSDSSAHAGLTRTDSEHSLGSTEDAVETFTTSQQTRDGSYTTTTTRRIHKETHQGHVEARQGHTEIRQESRHGHVEPRRGPADTRQGQSERSFLDSNTKVTGVQDILTRMKNADIVIEDGDTTEDTEARALLNKFLGASVLMAGMQGYVADSPSGNCVVKKETVRSSSSGGGKVTSARVQEVDLDQCWDERVLRNLLEECTDYELRRRLRARLRALMAEQEACASAVTEALASAEPAGDGGGDDVTAREEEAVTTVTSSVRRNSSEKTSTTTTTTTKTSKVTESLPRAPPKPVSPFAKFRQLEKQNSTNSPKM